MTDHTGRLVAQLQQHFDHRLQACTVAMDEVNVEIAAGDLLTAMTELRDHPDFCFEQLIDLCGVDYFRYGSAEWKTGAATSSGFSRGADATSMGRMRFGDEIEGTSSGRPRYAVVYHLLSYRNNQRLRVRVYAPDDELPMVDSVTTVWTSADWFEREAFDLYGILFNGHPDLRRLLTDYGFVGHPFRKDFPLTGHVEMRYDPERGRVVYQPVTIEPRVLVPRVVRRDHRYLADDGELEETGGSA